MGIKGVGIANTLTNMMIFTFLALVHICVKEIRDTLQWPNKKSFKDLYGYLELGLPISLMLYMEWWMGEVMLMLCGLISVHVQAAYFIENSIYVFYFCLAMGMQSAGCTCVGFQIGKGDVKTAKEYYRVSFHCVLAIAFLSSICFYTTFDSLIGFFTSDSRVIQAC